MNIKKSLLILPLLAIALGVSASGIVSSFNNKKVEVALAVNPISYISRSWDGLSGSIKNETKQCDDYEVITNIKKDWFNGWYVVNTNVSISERIITSGTVNLILCDGKSLTASKGIHVPHGATLNIYSQSEDTGTLVAAGIDNAAGIGGSSLAVDAGVINIYGGRVTAIGGQYGAGIGGGNKGAGAAVTIYGGRVNATAGLGASGIGNGYTGNVGTNIIYSGTVNATASYPGVAINGTLSVPNSLVVLGNDTQVPSYKDDQQASSSYATNRWPYMVVMHKHNWSYVASGNTITASCSYDDCLETDGLTLTINAGGATYDGVKHNTGTIKSGYNPLVFDNPTISYYKDNVLVDECINAGTYEARVTFGEATAVKQFTIEKDYPMTINNNYPEPVYPITYNGSYQDLIVPGTGVADGGIYKYKVNNGEWTEHPQGKEVGTYIVKIKIFGDSNHVDFEYISYAIDITKAVSLIETPPTAAQNLTYDGEAHALIGSSGTATGGTMQFKLENSDIFTSDIPTAIDAGTYIVNYYAKSNNPSYENSNVFSLIATIGKASINPTVSISDWVYNDEPSNPVVTDNPGDGKVIYEYKEADADDSYYSTDVPTDVGTYTIRATVKETANYLGGIATCNFSIIKATPTDYTVPTNLVASYGDKLSIITLPDNWSWKSPDDLVGNAGSREHIAIYTPTDHNYKAVEEMLTISVSTIGPTGYDIPSDLEATYGQKLSDIALPSGWAWFSPNKLIDTIGNNIFDAYYTPTDPNYHMTTEELMVKVNQATPTGYDIPTGLEATSGDILSRIELPDNWEWKAPDELVGDAGNREHVAIYTPEDKNYKDVEVSLTVLVKDSSTPTPGPTPDSNPDSSSYSNPDSNPEPTPEPSDNNNNFPVGAIVGIAAGSTVLAGTGGFAFVWFVIKKKSWADLLAIFKKK